MSESEWCEWRGEGIALAAAMAVAVGFPLYALFWGIPDPGGLPSPPLARDALAGAAAAGVASLALFLGASLAWAWAAARRGASTPWGPASTQAQVLHAALERYARGELSRQDYLRALHALDPQATFGAG